MDKKLTGAELYLYQFIFNQHGKGMEKTMIMMS